MKKDPYKTPITHYVKKAFTIIGALLVATWVILWAIFFFTNNAFGASGKITVYDEEGKVIHVEKFKYTPDTTPYKAPAINNRTIKEKPKKPKPKKDIKAPAPPTGMHFVHKDDWNERNENGRLKLRPGWKKLPYKDMTKRERAVWRRATKHKGRTRKVTGVKSYNVGQSQVTEIERLERDKKGQRYKTKETIYDNRSKARTTREQKKASENAPQATRTFEEEKIP